MPRCFTDDDDMHFSSTRMPAIFRCSGPAAGGKERKEKGEGVGGEARYGAYPRKSPDCLQVVIISSRK